MTLDGIMASYQNPPHKIFYDITQSSVPLKFTVLDALNLLFQQYITIEFNQETPSPLEVMFNLKEALKISPVVKILHKYERLQQQTLEQLQARRYGVGTEEHK
jgi:hypothetical protein